MLDAQKNLKEQVSLQLEKENELSALRVKYDNDVNNFQFALFEWEEALMEPVSLCNNVDSIVQVISRSEEVANQISAGEADLVKLEEMGSELSSNNIPLDTDVREVRNIFDEAKNSCGGRMGELQDAKAAQEAKQAARVAFAAAATALIEYCTETSRMTVSLTRRMSMTPESQAEKLSVLWESFNAEGNPLLESVETTSDAQNLNKVS